MNDSSTLLSLRLCWLHILSLLSRMWLDNRHRLIDVPLSGPLHIHSLCLSFRQLFSNFSDFLSSVQLLCVGNLKSSRPSIYYNGLVVISSQLVYCSLPSIILTLLFVGYFFVSLHTLGSSFLILAKNFHHVFTIHWMPVIWNLFRPLNFTSDLSAICMWWCYSCLGGTISLLVLALSSLS